MIRMIANFQTQVILLPRPMEKLGQKVAAIMTGTLNVFKVWIAEVRIRISWKLDSEYPGLTWESGTAVGLPGMSPAPWELGFACWYHLGP